MTHSPARWFATTLIAAAISIALTSKVTAQQTAPTEPTHPIEPTEPIAPAPNGPSSIVTPTRVPTENLDAAHLRQSLTRQGYHDIHGIQRDGSHYRVTAEKDGRPVELEIDTRTGRVTPQSK